MKGVTYCTSSVYNIKALSEQLKDRYPTRLLREVLQVRIPRNDEDGWVFYFIFGTMVAWGLTPEECERFVQEVVPQQTTGLESIEKDDFSFSFGEAAKIVKDEIIISNRDPNTLLAVSYALGRSIKLSSLETALQRIFNLTQYIPEDLARHGAIVLSRREIRRMMGQLFLERNSINLQCDVLDVPEFFWENIELEPLYLMVAHHFDIEKRVKVLNQRLNIVHELFNMLGSEINHMHSSRLEWTIILLIIAEVSLTLLKDIFHIL